MHAFAAPTPPPAFAAPSPAVASHAAPCVALGAMSLSASAPVPAVDRAERDVLELLASARYEKRAVKLPSGHVINTISAGDPALPTLVVAHGWGAGAAFFARNIDGLCTRFRVHFIDWLGFGASSRPLHPPDLSPEAAESFFLDAFEEWIEEMEAYENPRRSSSSSNSSCSTGDDRDSGNDCVASTAFAPFHLVGHSMGAFLSVGFALRRPELIRNLVLASPVGLPRAPANKLPPPTAPLQKRLLFWVVFTLWERGWTPQVLMRYTGMTIGRLLSSWMVTPRFPTSSEAQRCALVEYFYQISAATGSGEHALSTILESGAYARRPLCDKLPHVKLPVTFVYGDRDWMSWELADELRRSMPGATALARVADAGHHVYYDNPEKFNSLVIEACFGTVSR